MSTYLYKVILRCGISGLQAENTFSTDHAYRAPAFRVHAIINVMIASNFRELFYSIILALKRFFL